MRLMFVAILFAMLNVVSVAKATELESTSISKATEVGAIVASKDLDVQATYPGGSRQLAEDVSWIFKYPSRDEQMGTEGLVEVKFIVETDGSLSDLKVVKGQTLTMNKEALRVVSLLGPFQPGMKDGVAVRTALILPVRFQLQGYHPEN